MGNFSSSCQWDKPWKIPKSHLKSREISAAQNVLLQVVLLKKWEPVIQYPLNSTTFKKLVLANKGTSHLHYLDQRWGAQTMAVSSVKYSTCEFMGLNGDRHSSHIPCLHMHVRIIFNICVYTYTSTYPSADINTDFLWLPWEFRVSARRSPLFGLCGLVKLIKQ